MESVESEGMKGNDYLLNALLFGGVETFGCRETRLEGSMICFTTAFFPLSVINVFGSESTFFRTNKNISTAF